LSDAIGNKQKITTQQIEKNCRLLQWKE